MQIDFSKLIDPSYLLDPNPPYQFAGMWVLFGLFVLMLIAVAVLSLYRFQEWQEPYRKYAITPLWVTSLIGFILLFSRNQSIPYLSARLLLLLTILAFLLWLGYSFTVARKKVERAKILYEQREKLAKYLPKKKR